MDNKEPLSILVVSTDKNQVHFSVAPESLAIHIPVEAAEKVIYPTGNDYLEIVSQVPLGAEESDMENMLLLAAYINFQMLLNNASTCRKLFPKMDIGDIHCTSLVKKVSTIIGNPALWEIYERNIEQIERFDTLNLESHIEGWVDMGFAQRENSFRDALFFYRLNNFHEWEDALGHINRAFLNRYLTFLRNFIRN